jgi:hypothetical protein
MIKHPFRLCKFQPVLDNSENSETMRDPPVGDPVRTAAPNRTDSPRTTAAAALPHPQLPPPHRLPPTASGSYKRSTPLSSSSARFTAPASPCSPSLSHRGPPLWPLPDPLDTAQAPHQHRKPPRPLASALGCSSVPPPSLPTAWIVPSWNPLLW